MNWGMFGIVNGVIFCLNRNFRNNRIFRMVSSESCLYKTAKCWFRPSGDRLPMRRSRYYAEQWACVFWALQTPRLGIPVANGDEWVRLLC
jgi:hypothetical protein